MTSALYPDSWRVILGSARGAAHDARNMPNQDCAGQQVLAPSGGIVVAIADGHGHSRHFRSATGSRLAVAAACRVAERLAAELGQPWTAADAAALRDSLPPAIVADWRAEVAADLAAHPYTAEQQARLKAAADGPDIPYGSTLLVAVIAAGWLVCAQIGDGDVLAVRADGSPYSPVAAGEEFDGYRTTSLCQPDAIAAFRAAAHDLRAEPLIALLLGTDGYGNAQIKDPWQPAAAHDMAELAAAHDHRWFTAQVPVWAERCASARGSGDDTTIALLLAPDAAALAGAARLGGQVAARRQEVPTGLTTLPVPPVAVPAASTAPAASSAAAPPPAGYAGPDHRGRPGHRAPAAPRRRWRPATLAAAAAAAIAAVVLTVVLLQMSGGGHRDSPAPRQTAQPGQNAISTAAPPQGGVKKARARARNHAASPATRASRSSGGVPSAGTAQSAIPDIANSTPTGSPAGGAVQSQGG